MTPRKSSDETHSRDLGRLEGTMQQVLESVARIEKGVSGLREDERAERKALEQRLEARAEAVETRVSAAEKRAYVLHGIGLATMFVLTSLIDLKTAIKVLFRA